MKINRLEETSFLPVVLIVSALITLLVVLTGILPLLRPALVFAFLFLGPGLAFARLLPAEDIITRITFSIAISLGIDAVVAMLLLYIGAWSYQTILLIIVGITLAGSILQVKRGREQDVIQEGRE